jgi:hypothetical protein
MTALPSASSNQVLLKWITPQEQLERFALLGEVVLRTPLPLDIAKVVSAYVVENWMTDWHTAHSLLKSLPPSVPQLPDETYELMERRCPIYGDEMQDDGTYFKVKDKWFLALIPQELRSLDYFERRFLRSYGDERYGEGKNPLQFREFWGHATRLRYARFPKTHFVLMPKTVMPESRNKIFENQEALMEALSRKTGLDFEIPTAQQSYTAIVTHIVATGEICYQAPNEENGNVSTSTRVKDIAANHRLVVGGFNSSGGRVFLTLSPAEESSGVVPILEFPPTSSPLQKEAPRVARRRNCTIC